jgi:3-phosphoglycerate kinase
MTHPYDIVPEDHRAVFQATIQHLTALEAARLENARSEKVEKNREDWQTEIIGTYDELLAAFVKTRERRRT